MKTTDEIKNGWISVKDRLPNLYKAVLVCDEDCGMYVFTLEESRGVLYWSDDYCNAESCEIVTHWMPLPEPPKEE